MKNKIDQEQLEILAHKFKQGTLTDAERIVFENWYANHEDEILNLPEESDVIKSRIYGQIEKEIHGVPRSYTWFSRQMLFKAAACFLLLGAAGIYFFTHKTTNDQVALHQTDIKPGTNNAILTLANGKKIILNDDHNGVLVQEEGIRITRTGDGRLQYVITETGNEAINEYHTIETPRGGQHAVLLPDGTLISLNAASSLRYPASFAHATERRVELTGEAYFEVAKDPDKPFIVKTKNEEVEVLGTHFNLNSYPDEPESKTTLVEGMVKVRMNHEQPAKNKEQVKILKPGQQAVISATEFNIKNVDAESEVAWKDGEFVFTGQNLSTIMRMISRWYNVDIKYADKQIDQLQLEGQVSRTRNLSVVLQSLEDLSGINFKLKGKEVTISN